MRGYDILVVARHHGASVQTYVFAVVRDGAESGGGDQRQLTVCLAIITSGICQSAA